MEDLILTNSEMGGYIIGNQWFHIKDGELYVGFEQKTEGWHIKTFKILTNTKNYIIFDIDGKLCVYGNAERIIYKFNVEGYTDFYLRKVFEEIDEKFQRSDFGANWKCFAQFANSKNKILIVNEDDEKYIYNELDNTIYDVTEHPEMEKEMIKEYCQELLSNKENEE